MLCWKCLIVLLSISQLSTADWPDPFEKTHGQVWPQPAILESKDASFAFDPKKVKVVSAFDCDILRSALAGFSRKMNLAISHALPTKGNPMELRITVTSGDCPAEPQMGMDESYKLTVNESIITLTTEQAWGVIRGLETLSQLTFYSSSGLRMRLVSIEDYPRFPHRGLLLDTSRHFFSVPVIKALIDLMAQNKLNVFHWHLTDNEAFPFASSAYPELAKGAYDENHIYTAKNIREIVAFARLRGVRVLPEVDTPGHARSWGKALPAIMSRCFDSLGRESFDRAMLDPTNGQTYQVITAVFKELFNLFPERYFHLGGDEAEFWIEKCWENNPNVKAYMKLWGMNSTKDLEQHYFTRLLQHLTARDMPKKNFLVWQEVLDVGIRLDGAIGHIWKGNTKPEQMTEMKKVVEKGHLAILSSCWYLDHISWNIDYKEYYDCDPQDLPDVSDPDLSRVMGGEAAMWGEMVDQANVIARIFPRASAVAEKLWSTKEYTKSETGTSVWPRLYEWQCRMTERGFPIQPGNGPGFCPFEYQPALPDVNY